MKVARTPWLQSLNSNSEVVWKPPTGTMYSKNLWAPEIHRINDKWYAYVAADDGTDANHRMYVLEGDSQDPQGSYTLKGKITTPSDRWAIDGTILSHGGKNYMIWSGNPVEGVPNQSLYIAEMSNPWTLTGERVEISTPTLAWERHGYNNTTRGVNEGPEVLEHNGDVFLTYSGSSFDTPYYAIGALKLTGTNPLLASSWTDKTPTPLFEQGNGVYGPGHSSFVKSPDGTQDWIVYHARTDTGRGGRQVRIQPFTWNTDGTPNFGTPIATSQTITNPSGTPTVTFIPNLSFERGGTGWLDDFHVSGDVGATANDGSTFTQIANGDGPKIGYLGANVAGKIWQDIGPLTRTAYTLSVGLAISSDQQTLAQGAPAQFILRLIGTGKFPGGSANDGAVTILGQRTIDSSELLASNFQYFDLTVNEIGQDQIGNWLRVELATPDGLPVAASNWQVKMDLMTLSLPANAVALVPEPASITLLCGALALGMRRRRAA